MVWMTVYHISISVLYVGCHSIRITTKRSFIATVHLLVVVLIVVCTSICRVQRIMYCSAGTIRMVIPLYIALLSRLLLL